MLDNTLIESLEKYGIQRHEITAERLLAEIQKTGILFKLEIKDGWWSATYDFGNFSEEFIQHRELLYVLAFVLNSIFDHLKNTKIMLHHDIIESIEKYGIPRHEITAERLLTELQKKAVGFRLNDYGYEDQYWEAGFYLGEDWSTIYKPDILQLLALSYCAICAHEFHEALNRLNEKIDLVKS